MPASNPVDHMPEILPNNEKEIKVEEKKENVDHRYNMNENMYQRLFKRFMAEDCEPAEMTEEQKKHEEEHYGALKKFWHKFMAEGIAAPSEPAGLNSFIPELAKKEDEKANQLYSREEVDLMKSELEATKALYRKEVRTKDLDELVREGYNFSRDDELAFAVNLDDESYKQHLARIKKNYARSIAGQRTIPTALPQRGKTKEQCIKAAEMALKDKIPYAEALGKI